jgi:hypothetical protein
MVVALPPNLPVVSRVLQPYIHSKATRKRSVGERNSRNDEVARGHGCNARDNRFWNHARADRTTEMAGTERPNPHSARACKATTDAYR